MAETQRPHGIAVFDAQGRLALAAGTANEARLRAILADPEWRAGLRARRLQPLEPARDRRLLALLVPLAGGRWTRPMSIPVMRKHWPKRSSTRVQVM